MQENLQVAGPLAAQVYRCEVSLLPAVRLVASLNGLIHSSVAVDEAARRVLGSDVGHHVNDPDQLLNLDPVRSTPLVTALPAMTAAETQMWILTLPAPGALGSLRGPLSFNHAALKAGVAAIAVGAGIGLVPLRVGPAVQWTVHEAGRPFPPPSPYEAERALSEAIVAAGHALTALDVAAGPLPAAPEVVLGPGYSARQASRANRAATLLTACDAALMTSGASISSFEVDRRAQELTAVRSAAREALCSALLWPST